MWFSMTAWNMSAASPPSSPSDPGISLGYLALCWRGAEAPPRWMERLPAELSRHAPGLELCVTKPGIMVFGRGGEPRWEVSTDPQSRLTLIGTAFDRESLNEEGAEPIRADQVIGLDDDALLRRVWGSFIAIRSSRTAPALRLIRDASGSLPVLLVEAGDFLIIAPNLPRWLRDLAGIKPRIDRHALASALADPLLLTHRGLLSGVHHLPAGGAFDWDGFVLSGPSMLWPFADIVAEPARHDPQAADRLRRTVSGSISALGARHGRLTLELSGGLDSAIVLGALATSPRPVDISCVNFAITHAGGDERVEARAVAERWRTRLVEVSAGAEELRFEDLFGGEQPVEPILYGLDAILERASLGVTRAFDARAIFTGQGGDAVFCNIPTALVAVDYARAFGWCAHLSRAAYEAAQRAYRSIWHVEWLMLRDRLAGTRRMIPQLPGQKLGAAAKAESVGGTRHPWLRGDDVMAPARRMQLEAVANCQHFFGPTWRGNEAALVHPLLSQPIVETCLGIPTYRLATGSGNRAFAREVFADWLPDMVRNRRNKGEATNYYRRAIAENLPYLRDLLLNGTLVAHGLLDGAGIDAALRDESLIWTDQSRMIAAYASFEAWARYWGLGSDT